MCCSVIDIWAAGEPFCIEVRGPLIDLGGTSEVIAMRVRGFWIVIFIQLAALELFAQTGTQFPLEIYVYNQAGVPQGVLSRAEQRVSLILGHAGVEPEWLNCSTPAGRLRCAGDPDAGSVAVQIVHGTTKMPDGVFGATFLGKDGTGHQSDIFYDRIHALHQEWNISLPVLLGTVMAHELGHLLLGLNAHSTSGIMTPVWTSLDLWRVERGTLLFSVEQSTRIRERLGRSLLAASERPGGGN
jgi:hypothetical protein